MAKKEERRQFYRATEASRLLSVSLPTLRKWAMEGKIPSFLTPGKRYRYDVDGFLGRAGEATGAYHVRKREKAKQLELFASKPAPKEEAQDGVTK
jgi:excisionase family DNA binding protein